MRRTAWLGVGLALVALAACGPVRPKPVTTKTAPTPTGPSVTYVFNEGGATAQSWDAVVRPTAADAGLFRPIRQGLALATAIPIIGQPPAAGVDTLPAGTGQGVWVIGIAGRATPVTVAAGVVRCLPGATLSHGCSPVLDDAIVDGKPELAPGVLKALSLLPYTHVVPLAVHASGGRLRVSGKGWVGPVTLVATWGKGGVQHRLATVSVDGSGDFQWSGPIPIAPAGTTGNLRLTAHNGFTQMSAPA